MKQILFILFVILSVGFACTDNKYSNIENEKIIQGILFSDGNGAVSCKGNESAFSSLNAAGLSGRCGGCHSSSSPKGGVDVSSYSSVSAKVTIGNPEASIFYTSIKSGSMSSFSDSTLNNAVYCWIKAGASR